MRAHPPLYRSGACTFEPGGYWPVATDAQIGGGSRGSIENSVSDAPPSSTRPKFGRRPCAAAGDT